MSEERITGRRGRATERVLDVVRARIADRVYPVGTLLPAQRELADELRVSRETVKRALDQLSDEGLIDTRQGSGSRVIEAGRLKRSESDTSSGELARQGPFISRAFEQSEVALDVYTLTSESLDAHVRLQAERIGAGEISPERVTLRLLLPAKDVNHAYPRTKGSPDDPRLQERLHALTVRHAASLRNTLKVLQTERLVPSVDFQMRRAPLTPTFKLYVVNGAELLFGPYKVVERTIQLDSGEELEALDVLGLTAVFTRFGNDDAPHSQGSRFVEEMQAWFDSVWNNLAE
ncbi:winged helix-turn-helix domain-containing protein [Streptomyces sp. NBC_01356]|uniref:winged helix-turn-helix domain-containing protein n=1 Tax=Streptomyces sp. NBC_01356 TaxID=2903836 RepID=UPI002E326445|nr:winged helix-turn-helix domain-containing protein [Streptomyces sp. NBC_01356]